jgi:response regulator RpfG family c-di-GMP phosphodiesterase
MRVLLVDDDEPTRMICRRILMRLSPGLEVDEAQDGARAMDLLRGASFSGILCDYRMGHVSGLDVLRFALLHQPEAYRALMTGFADPALERAAREQAGVNAFIEKPMTSQEFESVLSARFLGPLLGRLRPEG